MALQLPAEGHETEESAAPGAVAAFAGRLASTPVAHVSAVSVSSSTCSWPELSLYVPTALQLPAEAHDTDARLTAGLVPAFAGRLASTPVAHVPAVSVSSSPCAWPEPSLYVPTALQLPAEAHETDATLTAGLVPAFTGRLASTPVAHVPAVSVISSPCTRTEPSLAWPTALRLPAEAHDSDLSVA